MIVRGLLSETTYMLAVKGIDAIGNVAVSDSQRFTTATDTRPPAVSKITITGSIVSSLVGTDQPAQLVISWNTDEPSTSQIEFSEGTGNSYSLKSQKDSALTSNHTVVLSGLAPAKVYHLRVVSEDSAGNSTYSSDRVTITPQVPNNALDLVISSLSNVFKFIRE